MATTQSSVRIVKSFTYRGGAQEFSNRYYFDGAAPADTAAWTALFDQVTAQEKAIYTNRVQIIAAHGYDAGSEVAVATKVYALAGTLAVGVSTAAPGDAALVLRMATTKKSIKNHTVYVFSYWHGAQCTGSGSDGDTVFATQLTNATEYGLAWQTGIVVGGRTYKRTTPDGHPTTGRAVEPFIGHRDFLN